MEPNGAADLVIRSAFIAFCLPPTVFLLAIGALLVTIGIMEGFHSKDRRGRMPRAFVSAGLLTVALVHGLFVLIGIWHAVFLNPPEFWRLPLLGLTVYVVSVAAFVLLPRSAGPAKTKLSHG